MNGPPMQAVAEPRPVVNAVGVLDHATMVQGRMMRSAIMYDKRGEVSRRRKHIRDRLTLDFLSLGCTVALIKADVITVKLDDISVELWIIDIGTNPNSLKCLDFTNMYVEDSSEGAAYKNKPEMMGRATAIHTVESRIGRWPMPAKFNKLPPFSSLFEFIHDE